MDSCLLQKGQHQMVQWSIRQLELMLEDILKSSLIGWGFWDKFIGRITIVMRSNAGVWSIKRNNVSGFSVESVGLTPQHGRLGIAIGCLQPEFVASLFVLYVGFC